MGEDQQGEAERQREAREARQAKALRDNLRRRKGPKPPASETSSGETDRNKG